MVCYKVIPLSFTYCMTAIFTASVIPAQAGIQLVIKLRAADQAVFGMLSHFVGILIMSGFRPAPE